MIIKVYPIDPNGGRDWTAISEVAGRAIIAARTHVSGLLAPSLRLFNGDVAGYGPGDMFDSYNTAASHYGAPCGVWTVFAVVSEGRITQGAVPQDGQTHHKFMTFELMTLAKMSS